MSEALSRGALRYRKQRTCKIAMYFERPRRYGKVIRLPFRVAIRLPTIAKAGAGGLRIAMTRSLGAFVGRTIPVVGIVMLGWDAFLIMQKTIFTYNRLAKAEDRVP